jgi:hypothetical protein
MILPGAIAIDDYPRLDVGAVRGSRDLYRTERNATSMAEIEVVLRAAVAIVVPDDDA